MKASAVGAYPKKENAAPRDIKVEASPLDLLSHGPVTCDVEIFHTKKTTMEEIRTNILKLKHIN